MFLEFDISTVFFYQVRARECQPGRAVKFVNQVSFFQCKKCRVNTIKSCEETVPSGCVTAAAAAAGCVFEREGEVRRLLWKQENVTVKKSETQ